MSANLTRRDVITATGAVAALALSAKAALAAGGVTTQSEPARLVALVPNNRAAAQQNTATLKTAIERIMTVGGTVTLPPNQTFWINALTASPGAGDPKRVTCVIEGNGSTLICNTNNVERYFELRTDDRLWNEHGRVIINQLTLESNTLSEDRFAAGHGFAFDTLRNIDLELNRCSVAGFWRNIIVNRCWPVTMNNCMSRKGEYQLDILDATTSRFNRCQFIEGRYGIVVGSSNKSVFNQHFVGCRFETLRCLGFLTAVRGEQVHETRFTECYIENFGRPLIVGLKLRPEARDRDPMSNEKDFLMFANGQYRYFEPSGGGVNNTWFVGNYWTQSEDYKRMLGSDSVNHWNKKWFPARSFATDPQRRVVMPESRFEDAVRG